MLRLVTAAAFVIAFLAISPADGLARDTRTFVRTDDQGTTVLREITETGTPPPQVSTSYALPLRDGGVLWQRTHDMATYLTVEIAGSPGAIAAGTYLNDPRQVELVPIEGDGTPTWTFTGREFYTAASRDGSVIAAVDAEADSQFVTVYRWNHTSPIPLWSYLIKPATRGNHRTIAVSADGSTIAVLVSMQLGSPEARLYLFDPDSPTPIGVHDGAGFARNLSIGEDGRFTAFIGLSTAFVVDRDADLIRWSGSMGATNDPIAISTDGNHLAFGWTSLQMRQWNGSFYESLWNLGGGAYTFKTCGFSGDGNTFVAAWNRGDFLRNRVQLFEMPDSNPLWTYDYTVASGEHQDVPTDLAVTRDGGFVAVASWGDQLNTNHELHLFEHATAMPIFTVDTPGSMFDVDIADDGGCGVYIAACGKHIHANESGRGGDLFSIHYTCPAGVTEEATVTTGPSIRLLPNPFRASSPIHFALPSPSLAEIAVFTSDGRRVRTLLSSSLDAGSHEVSWDGKNDRGRAVSSGIYFVRLRADNRLDWAKTTLLR